MLERYPDEIIGRATSPITGIQRECKFPPSIAEFVAFCDEVRRRASYADEWNRRAQEQLAEREEFERNERREPLEHRNRVAERIKAELRKHGFKFENDPYSHGETSASVKAKLGISDQDWDALPDSPKKDDFWQGVRWPENG